MLPLQNTPERVDYRGRGSGVGQPFVALRGTAIPEREITMCRFLLFSFLATVTSASVWGQQTLPPPAVRPRTDEPRSVPIVQKLRYICKQLDLDEKQRQHAEGLFAVLEAEATSSPEDLRRHLEMIQAKYQDVQAAEQAGDTERAEKLREELKNLAPGVMAERNFINGLSPALRQDQKVKLESLLKELENVSDLSLKPIQVIRLARQFKLTGEQREKLAQAEQSFRKAMAEAGPAEQSTRNQMVDKLATDVAAILEPAQRAEFERQVGRLRPDTPPVPPPAPTTAPAASPAGPRPTGP